MRPLEITFSAANLLAFVTLALPLSPALRWTRCFVILSILIAIAQIGLEGARWQMIPAYLLAICFMVIGVWRILQAREMSISPIISAIGIGIGGTGVLLAAALPILLPVFYFAKPSGPYAIGTVTYHWVDQSRTEMFRTDTQGDREIMAQVWYPAQDEPTAPRALYMPDADSVTPVMARLTGFPTFFFSHFRYVTTNAVTSAPIVDSQSRFPVLIFLAGLNSYRQLNTFQIEELVSHGYIVVGLDQPGAMALVHFPDGHDVSGLPRDEIQPIIAQSVEPITPAPSLFGKAMPEGIIPYFAADVSFALDQLAEVNASDPNKLLTGHLDLDHAGIFGISLGGINAAEACFKDLRLKACLIMDVFMTQDVADKGLQQPAIWITRDADTMRLERSRAGGWTEKDIAQHQTTMRAAYEKSHSDRYFLQIPNMFHINMTDAPYWSPILSQIGMTGPIDGQRVFDILNAYSVTFFDQYLKSEPSTLLNGPAAQYPEVSFESRRG